MSCNPHPATRKVQFRDPTCDDEPPSFAPKVAPKNEINPSLARKVHFKDSVCDNLKLPFALKADPSCDANLASPAEKIQVEDSICDDLNPPLAPKIECKDDMCDNLDSSLAQVVQDELQNDFNPSFAVKQCDDSVCNDRNIMASIQKDECEDPARKNYNQSLAPMVKQRKEMNVDDPIPAIATKVETKEKMWSPCANPGNPIFSCMAKIPTPSYSPVPFVKPQNPLYRTTSAAYGSNQPTCESAPSIYKPLSQSFSAALRSGGMYRNSSLNTSLDKNRVHNLLPF